MGLDSNLLNGMEYCGEINTLKKLMPWRLGISPSLGFTFISRPTSFILLASSTMATSILERSKLNSLTTFINTYTSLLSQKNINMPKSRPLSLQTVELKVRMCCAGCERVVRNAIMKLKGVDTVEVNLELEKVTVIGYVDRNKVLKAVRRSGKRAEFWPNNVPLYFTNASNYFRDINDYKESYNYWRHGYHDPNKHGAIPITNRGDDKVSNMFNDDNVNATCSVM